jgi:hypothetical protein
MLNEDDPKEGRTALQYLIEILHILNDKSIARLIYLFLFNKMDRFKQNP